MVPGAKDQLVFNMPSLRKLVSSFDHPSTYYQLRATLDDFNETRVMPSTVFTLCNTPSQDGYGANYDSAAKLRSLLLQQSAKIYRLKKDLTSSEVSIFMQCPQLALISDIVPLEDLVEDFVNKKFISIPKSTMNNCDNLV